MELENRGFEHEFFSSWDRMETFFTSIDLIQEQQVLEMISEMRRCGYDKTLRAGQRMMLFILSRSKYHGLNPNQPHVIFDFVTPNQTDRDDALSESIEPHSYPTNINIFPRNLTNNEKITMTNIKFTPEIDTILKQLVSFPID